MTTVMTASRPKPSALRVYRTVAMLTQRELAYAAGVSARTVHRLEQGEVGSLRTFRKLAAALEVPVEAILPPDGPDDA